MSSGMRRLLTRLAAPLKGMVLRTRMSVVLTMVVAVGLLAVVSRIAAAHNSAAQLWTVLQGTSVLVLVLTIPYLLARALVWQSLLQELRITVPFRHMLISFAGGEITKTLPAGVYVQNYLLARLEHFSQFSVMRSTMATTAILGLESAIALPVALIFGVPGQPWIFWSLIGITSAWVVLLFLAWMLVHRWGPDFDHRLPQWLRRVRVLAEEFLQAGAELIKPKTMGLLVPVAVYMLFYVIELYAIILAVGIKGITFADTMGIYALVVLVVVLVPIPTEIGLTEFAGLGALVAYNVPRSTAAIVMLSLRILATGMTVLVASVVMLVLRSEFVASELDAVTVPQEKAPG